MTREDLEDARRKIWHQDGNALLVFEDVLSWVRDMGWVRAHALNAAVQGPELATAIAGGKVEDREASAEAERHARTLTARMVAAKETVLLPSDSNQVGATDDGDILVSRALLPYFYSIGGDRTPRKPPEGTPLAKEIWESLKEGPASSLSIANTLGRGVTEGAVLRQLRELWLRMRVVPLPEESDVAPSLWARLDLNWPDEVKQGIQISQPEALSALISEYLRVTIAAGEDDVIAALAAWTSRQRVREVLQALVAARQLEYVAVDRGSCYALSKGAAAELQAAADERDKEALRVAREEHAAKIAAEPKQERPPSTRPWEKRERKPDGRREWKPSPPREGAAASGDRPPRREWKPRPPREGAAAFGDRGPKRDWKPRTPRAGASASGDHGPKREWKPRAPREGGSSFAGRSSDRGPKREWKPRTPRERASASGDHGPKREWKPRTPREGGSSFAGRSSDRGPKREWKPRTPREGLAASGDRPPRRDRKPRATREGAPSSDRPRRDFKPRGEWKPRPPREGAPAHGDRPARREWKPRPSREGASASGDRPARREWKPRPSREGASASGDRPARREWKPRPPREGGSSFAGRPSDRGPKREWKPRPPREGADASGDRPARREGKPRPPREGAPASRDRGPKREWKPRPSRKGASSASGDRPRSSGPEREWKPRAGAPKRSGFGSRPPQRSFHPRAGGQGRPPRRPRRDEDPA